MRVDNESNVKIPRKNMSGKKIMLGRKFCKDEKVLEVKVWEEILPWMSMFWKKLWGR